MLAARIVWRTRCSLVGMPWTPSLQQAGRRVPGAAPGPPWSAAELAPLTLRDSTMAVQARCGSAAAKTKPTPATKRPSAIHVGSMAHLILQEGTLKQQSSRTVLVPGLQKKTRPAPATRNEVRVRRRPPAVDNPKRPAGLLLTPAAVYLWGRAARGPVLPRKMACRSAAGLLRV
jgi:hypothetical protein